MPDTSTKYPKWKLRSLDLQVLLDLSRMSQLKPFRTSFPDRESSTASSFGERKSGISSLETASRSLTKQSLSTLEKRPARHGVE